MADLYAGKGLPGFEVRQIKFTFNRLFQFEWVWIIDHYRDLVVFGFWLTCCEGEEGPCLYSRDVFQSMSKGLQGIFFGGCY